MTDDRAVLVDRALRYRIKHGIRTGGRWLPGWDNDPPARELPRLRREMERELMRRGLLRAAMGSWDTKG